MALKQFGWGKRCDRCGKGFQNIMNLSHSHIRTNRKSMPNLHKTTLTVGGATRQFRFCTKCLRIMKDTFGQVYKDASKIVKEVQVEQTPVKTPEEIVETVAETVNTPEVEESEVVSDEPKKKTKKASKVKVKKESSRKKSISELIEEDDE
jgi:large subunit ribosomal protein L28